ncbi:MAG TPA: glycosyltransferase family 2 protein [Anaerolineales bacterium]|nr:glycosyltransferase family 2 protein [Anaerolineales bacterium]
MFVPNVQVCAIIVTYHPDPSFPARLEKVGRQVGRVLIVDNSGNNRAIAFLKGHAHKDDVEVIYNSRNLGVAAALNLGAARARDLGFAWALTLDQDSEPSEDMVRCLWSVLQGDPRPETLAILAPQIIEASLGRPARFLRAGRAVLFDRPLCDGGRTMEVTTAITSGSLLGLRAHSDFGGFREDFFMDYVDTEYCLRAQTRGYRILAVCSAKLYHRLGDRKEISLGPLRLYPTFYGPDRWYTLSRNRIPMVRRYGLRFPHWLLYEVLASAFITARMLLAEPQRRAKVKAILRGTWDGLLGRMGPPDAFAESPAGISEDRGHADSGDPLDL